MERERVNGKHLRAMMEKKQTAHQDKVKSGEQKELKGQLHALRALPSAEKAGADLFKLSECDLLHVKKDLKG